MKSTLREIREKLNFTQVDAAEYLGLSRRSYQSYENNPSYFQSKKYYYLLRELEELYFNEDKGILSIEEITYLSRDIFRKYPVYYCYLFGSYAQGTASENSDVDLLISTELTGLKFYSLVEELRVALRKKVDALELHQVEGNLELLNEILKEGIKIYG